MLFGKNGLGFVHSYMVPQTEPRGIWARCFQIKQRRHQKTDSGSTKPVLL